MAKIKIRDLPRDVRITREEMKKVLGGAAYIKFDLAATQPLDKPEGVTPFIAHPMDEMPFDARR